jgi:hypothetical protein
MAFVDRAKTSVEDIKNTVLKSEDHDTQTAGVRHTPAAEPIGEGIYAITKTGRESHLAYILTVPSPIGQVQRDVGLRQRGSFVLSTKNPSHESPAYANLGRSPDYPQE